MRLRYSPSNSEDRIRKCKKRAGIASRDPALFLHSTFYISHFTSYISHHTSHTRRGSQGSQRCRQDGHRNLQDCLPKFFVLHGCKFFNGFLTQKSQKSRKIFTTQHLNSFNRAEGTCLYFCAFRAFCVTFNLYHPFPPPEPGISSSSPFVGFVLFVFEPPFSPLPVFSPPSLVFSFSGSSTVPSSLEVTRFTSSPLRS